MLEGKVFCFKLVAGSMDEAQKLLENLIQSPNLDLQNYQNL